MRRIPEHLVGKARELAVVHRGELVQQLRVRKGVFGDDHADTVEIRRQLAEANELCIVLGADSCQAAA